MNIDERGDINNINKDAIVVSGIQKIFRLPHEKRNTFFEFVTGIFRDNIYEEFVSLKNINFTVKKGEAVGIIGENGSGKSTLLKVIAHILRANKGSVKINGKITSFLELGVGFQPDLTVKENVYLYGTVMGLPDHKIDLDKILDFSGLRQFRDAKLKNLSSGMQVRLAFSTAIQTDPDILLLDEVLAVGDMEFQKKCLDVFHNYRKQKKTVVLVSHDMNSVRQFCDKVLLLRHGEQIAFGNANEVIDKYIYGIDVNKTKQINELENKNRFGSKKIEMTDVKFYDKFNNANNNFQTGDPLTIRIFYKASEPCENPTFGFSIYSDKDMCCYGTNTAIQNYKIDILKDEGYLDITFEKMLLMQGKYSVAIIIHGMNQEVYDWIDKQFSFNVVNKTKETGLVVLPCSWTLHITETVK